MADFDSTPAAAGTLAHLGDKQRARYLSARRGRNRGPKGGGFPDRGRTLRYVVVDVALTAGEIVNGKPVPAGSSIKGWPIAGPLRSRRQCKRAQQRLKGRHPACYRVAWKTLHDRPDERCDLPQNFPASLVLGGAA